MELHELPSGTTSTSSWGTAMSTTSSSWRRCGNWNSRLKLLHWRSKSNHVQIRFTSDNSYSSSGFQLLATVERSEWLLSPFLTIINLSKVDAVAAESTTLFLHCLPWMKCFWKWLAGLKREPIDPLHSTLRLAKMLSLGRRQNQMKFRQIENQSQIMANHFRWVKKKKEKKKSKTVLKSVDREIGERPKSNQRGNRNGIRIHRSSWEFVLCIHCFIDSGDGRSFDTLWEYWLCVALLSWST